MSGTRTDNFSNIQEFGEAFELTIFSDSNNWLDLAELYRALNSRNNPFLEEAINAEMEQRGLLPAVEIVDGQLPLDETNASEEIPEDYGNNQGEAHNEPEAARGNFSSINNNDRSSSAGSLHPGQGFVVPPAEQRAAFFNL